MKKVLCVVGAGLVVGAVAATLYYMNNKKKKASEEACEHKKFDDKFETENSESSKDLIIKVSEDTNAEIDDISAELDRMIRED